MNDGDKVKLGNVTMTAHLTPGHTKGCTTWTIKVKDGSKQSDVVFVGRASVPGYRLVGNEQYPTIVQDYERTFSILRKLRSDVFLAPHGNFFSMLDKIKLLENGAKTNPFIDPDGCRNTSTEPSGHFMRNSKASKMPWHRSKYIPQFNVFC